MSADRHNGYLPRAAEGAKEKGAYYTPDTVVRSLINWVVRSADDRLLDPSCGDGRFIELHHKSVGIEQDSSASTTARLRAPGALIHEGDFFTWAASTDDRFDCAAGNPPFIRYQRFKGDVRKRALSLCEKLGVKFSALSSSWPLFLVSTANLLQAGGRLAFVVPAEIGHAPYSAPLIEYLAENFQHLQIVAVRKKIFPELSEDCWLLFAEGKGGSTSHVALTVLESFEFSEAPPPISAFVDLDAWRNQWNKRFRPFLLPSSIRNIYESIVLDPESVRFGDIAQINIGYVSGANDFFHLRPSEVANLGIPREFLQTTVRNTRALPPSQLNGSVVKRWLREDRQTLLLRIRKDQDLPRAVCDYLDTSRAKDAANAYKCRTRNPWYVVPDVKIPNFFLSYMSGRNVSLVRNSAECACTNSLHTVLLKNRSAQSRIQMAQRSPLFQLSCEVEGHPLGGGMLKLEPREASNIVIPSRSVLANIETQMIQEGIATLQAWRHYEKA